jgi:HNH endonuclease
MSTRILDPKVCGIKECALPSLALGLCNKHWRRMKRYGSPLATKRHVGQFIGLSPEERFWMQVKKAEACWIWKGGTDQDGYGCFRGESHGILYHRAHRYSWALHNGRAVPKYALICHTCDQPRCVRPEHLYLGTSLDNMRDKIRKGRMRVAYGEQAGHAKLTEEQAKAILRDPRPYAEISADYNVTPATIGNLKQRRSWKHID